MTFLPYPGAQGFNTAQSVYTPPALPQNYGIGSVLNSPVMNEYSGIANPVPQGLLGQLQQAAAPTAQAQLPSYAVGAGPVTRAVELAPDIATYAPRTTASGLLGFTRGATGLTGLAGARNALSELPGGGLGTAGIALGGQLLGSQIQQHTGLNTVPYHVGGAIKGAAGGYGLGALGAGLLGALDIAQPEIGLPLTVLAGAAGGGILGFLHHGKAGAVDPTSAQGVAQNDHLIRTVMDTQLANGGLTPTDHQDLLNQYHLALTLAGDDPAQKAKAQQAIISDIQQLQGVNQQQNQQNQMTLQQQATVAKLLQPYVQNLVSTAQAQQQAEEADRNSAPANIRPLMDLVAREGVGAARREGAALGASALTQNNNLTQQLYNAAQTLKNKGKNLSKSSAAAPSLSSLLNQIPNP